MVNGENTLGEHMTQSSCLHFVIIIATICFLLPFTRCHKFFICIHVLLSKTTLEADTISKPILQMRKWKHGKFNQPVLSYTACKHLIEILTQQPGSPDPARGSGSTPVKLNASLSVLSCNSWNIILFLSVITGTRLCKTIQSLILIFCSQGVTSYSCGKIRIYVLSSIISSSSL